MKAFVCGLVLLATQLTMLSCKQKTIPSAEDSDSADVQFLPVAAAAAYGIGVSTEAIAASLIAAGGLYTVDCTRPVVAGEIRFFCDGPTRLGVAAVQLILNSTRTLASALHWSGANIVSHLAELSKFSSPTHLKAALAGTSASAGIAAAEISPQITSESGRRNFIHALNQSIEIKDRDKKSCNFIAQYEARLVPRNYKGNYMGGTMTRFFARAQSPESAEAMALTACDWFAHTVYRLAPGFAGYSSAKNDCRKPRSIQNYKEVFKTSDIGCPSVRVCKSEADCADFPTQ
ncbi:hypothetical protein EBU99_08230 [bacterium]|nr:hypothetical protein [bacterium]